MDISHQADSLKRERDKLKAALEGIHEHCLVETPEQTFERCRKALGRGEALPLENES